MDAETYRAEILDALTGEVGPFERLIADLAAHELVMRHRVETFVAALEVAGADVLRFPIGLERARLAKSIEARLKVLGLSQAQIVRFLH
ncbi:MAG TPA: hypothetical protein VF329_04275 [Gammaproteobacteria bacterium]